MKYAISLAQGQHINIAFNESQEKPSIDNLMKIVEEAMSAYKACKSRVDAVQQAFIIILMSKFTKYRNRPLS